MLKKMHMILAMMFLLLCISKLYAEEQFGIPVYMGAKYEQSASDFLQVNVNAFCYQTDDSMVKVIDFYKSQPELALINENETGAFFRRCKSEEYNTLMEMTVYKDCDLDLTIQNPWMDMNTNKIYSDNLICFVQR